MKIDSGREKKIVEQCSWARSSTFRNYNQILGHFQALSCLEAAKKGSLLELACGDGTMTNFFSKHFGPIVGVDASSMLIRQARKKAPMAKYHESLLEDLTLSEKFDSVFMINLLEHVIDPVFCLKKAYSFLKKRGTLIVHVPNAYAINRKIAVRMGTLLRCDELSPYDIKVAGHRRAYGLKSFVADIKKAGLTCSKTGGVFYKMLSTPQMDWFLKNGLWKKGGFGWGRLGGKQKDWKTEFCCACYEIGKERPEDCNIIYAVIVKN